MLSFGLRVVSTLQKMRQGGILELRKFYGLMAMKKTHTERKQAIIDRYKVRNKIIIADHGENKPKRTGNIKGQQKEDEILFFTNLLNTALEKGISLSDLSLSTNMSYSKLYTMSRKLNIILPSTTLEKSDSIDKAINLVLTGTHIFIACEYNIGLISAVYSKMIKSTDKNQRAAALAIDLTKI